MCLFRLYLYKNTSKYGISGLMAYIYSESAHRKYRKTSDFAKNQ